MRARAGHPRREFPSVIASRFNLTGSCDVQKPKLGGANAEIYFLWTKTFFTADHAKKYSQGEANSNALEAESACQFNTLTDA